MVKRDKGTNLYRASQLPRSSPNPKKSRLEEKLQVKSLSRGSEYLFIVIATEKYIGRRHSAKQKRFMLILL